MPNFQELLFRIFFVFGDIPVAVAVDLSLLWLHIYDNFVITLPHLGVVVM